MAAAGYNGGSAAQSVSEDAIVRVNRRVAGVTYRDKPDGIQVRFAVSEMWGHPEHSIEAGELTVPCIGCGQRGRHRKITVVSIDASGFVLVVPWVAITALNDQSDMRIFCMFSGCLETNEHDDN